VIDLSITGCAIRAPAELAKKSVIAITLVVPLRDGDEHIATWAEPVGTSEDGRIGLKFRSLDVVDLALLKRLLDEIS